ncbi:MAG: DJ-1/PfpI family protein [Candidatus Ancaeobacter aquaticus]|nr:DJ-1/PfpI family protein [Candidatus Ancaeobacter aquaticus]
MNDKVIKLGALIFDDFELLDLFGPLEMFGMLNDKIQIVLISEKEKIVTSRQGPQIISDSTFKEAPYLDVLLIPGGPGTRKEVNNKNVIDYIYTASKKAQYVATVCTGAALLAKTGLLNNCNATTNKIAFNWVVEQNRNVNWIPKARWVEDGKYFTSSGVSAGMDMALGLIERMFSKEESNDVAKLTEYVWNSDKDNDPFVKEKS